MFFSFWLFVNRYFDKQLLGASVLNNTTNVIYYISLLFLNNNNEQHESLLTATYALA